MSQAGGSATINGILYQLLGTLEWEVRSTLELQLADSGATAATLIIEPTGGGGDVRVHSPRGRIVEQWKSKSDGGTWSLNEIIDDVFPDLYHAVAGDRLDEKVEYWFVTEGRVGAWKAAHDFFASLTPAIPDDPLAALDGQRKIIFSPKRRDEKRSLVCSRRTLFKRIVKKLREKDAISETETELETCRNLWHLLARFRTRWKVSFDEVRRQVTDQLRGFINHTEDVTEELDALVGSVMRYAGKGQVTVDAGELLRRAGLHAYSFRAWPRIRERLRQRLDRQMARAGYLPARDARPVPAWPEGKSILVLSGESGQGKSWQLAALAREAAARDGFVAWVRSTDDAADDLQASADEVLKKGLGRTQGMDFGSMALTRAQVVSNAPQPWVTVCIDGMQTFAQARRLLDEEWEEWGARLAITVPAAVADSLRNEFAARAEIVPVQDFTVPQLQVCLAKLEHDWNSVPGDVRHTLLRPLLAGLYCEVADDPTWTPDSEYELYARVWRKLTVGVQADHSLDLTYFRRLTLRALDAGTPYPWPLETVAQVGMEDDMRHRLIATGWLRQAGPEHVEVWHDRLLNWVVAASLVRRRLDGGMTAGELAERVRALSVWRRSGREVRLGYVPTDVLWLASGEKNRVFFEAELPGLIVAAEGDRFWGVMMEGFYREVLSSLGMRIVPALVERLRVSPEQNGWNPFPRFVADCLAQIAGLAPAPVAEVGKRMLRDASSGELREAAVRLLTVRPVTGVLNDLWTLHVQSRQGRRNDHRMVETHDYYQRTSGALNACLGLEPEWLARKIAGIDPAYEPAEELAYSLANLAGRGGDAIWPCVKGALIAKVPPDQRRSLARCIERYRDAGEKDALIAWLPQEGDWLGPTAFGALAVVAPDEALARLPTQPMQTLSLYSNWWLPELLARRPAATHEALRRWMSANPGDTRPIAHSYAHYVNEMDTATLDLLLEDLGAQVAQGGAAYRLLQLLAKVSRWELLERFAARAGTSFERQLTDLACRYVTELRDFDEVKDMRSILLKVGGECITRLTNACLGSPERIMRLNGFPYATVRPDEETRRLLGRLAQVADTEESEREWSRAVEALAEIGEDAAVFEAVLRSGIHHVTIDTAEIVRRKPLAVGEEAIARAIQMLTDGPDDARANACVALGLGGRRECVPQIREICRTADPGSELAYSVLYALDCLGEDPTTLADLARPQMHTENRLAVRRLLLREPTPATLNVVEEDFDSHPDDGCRWVVGRELCKDPARRERVLARLWGMVRQNHYLDGAGDVYDLVAELGTDEVQSFLWTKAQPVVGGSFVQDTPLMALCGLVKLAPEPAVRAVASELTNGGSNRAELASLLAEYNPAGSIRILCVAAVNEPEAEVRWAIGRVLRLHPDGVEVARTVGDMMSSGEPVTRRVGVELCGRLSACVLDEPLSAVAENDPMPLVRGFAKAAQKQRRNETVAAELIGKLGQLTGATQWAVLEAMLAIADPHLLGHKRDLLGFRAAASSLGMAAWRLFDRRIEERVKEEKKRAEKTDETIRQD